MVLDQRCDHRVERGRLLLGDSGFLDVGFLHLGKRVFIYVQCLRVKCSELWILLCKKMCYFLWNFDSQGFLLGMKGRRKSHVFWTLIHDDSLAFYFPPVFSHSLISGSFFRDFQSLQLFLWGPFCTASSIFAPATSFGPPEISSCMDETWSCGILDSTARKWQELTKRNHIGIIHMGVSQNGGTPKSSILIGCSFVNHPFWDTPILETPICSRTSCAFTFNWVRGRFLDVWCIYLLFLGSFPESPSRCPEAFL